ncbi:acyltransferase [Bradyrhizobium sp. 83012]|uniref:Acyltransferase n=1 Tax=Bradyrhizobium aeschynomenes TaxID=2734909 RepID=A0ABX2CAN0_9BRAD|nr:acyltransferase family protein [Bradyrhizobium aeschynomenes]NPU15523.1 acyltransferase [Bradyrhizobium aeschynomenes]NPU65153.1 acyltransferase [Bradyrhizobium aeschynomenes]
MHSPVETHHARDSIHGALYRPDIDGLRAVAVVSVVAFHAFPNTLRSGFVGVDIFFVISGFLITSIILGGMQGGTFSFQTFYARRIKRIFPALALVLAGSVLAGALLLLPDDFRLLGKHVAAGAGFVSNFALWQEANYFDVAADTKILLHLWSLGIEEQFYLLWPALIWIAWRLRLNLFTVFVAVFAASLFYSIKATPSNPAAAFYSPAARFWELSAGSILAYLAFSTPRAAAWIENGIATVLASVLFERGAVDEKKIYRDFVSVVAIALIAASVLMITRRQEFPGWWALMPVAGSYLAILAGPGALLNRVLLSNPVMVWIGLISYPLYLWHWPLLTFARIHYGASPAPQAVLAFLVAASVGLAWATYQFVEKPIRFGARRVWAVPGLAMAMIAIGGCGLLVFEMQGLPGRLNDENKREYAAYFYGGSPLIQAEAQDIMQNRCNFYAWDSPVPTLAPRKAIDPSCYMRHSDKSVLILGDSNAADLYYGLNEVLPKDVSVLLIHSSGCQVSPIIQHIVETHHCNMANHFALRRIEADPPDVLLLSSNNSFDIEYIRKFSMMVKGYGVKKVLVLGQRPHWKRFLHKIILDEYWKSTPRYIPGHLDEELMSFTQKFQSQLKRDEPFDFVDEMQPFCSAEGCLTFLGDNRREGLITADTVHLRPFASVWLARRQLAPLILRSLGN